MNSLRRYFLFISLPIFTFLFSTNAFCAMSIPKNYADQIKDINLRELSNRFLPAYKEFSVKEVEPKGSAVPLKIKPELSLQEFERVIDLFIELFADKNSPVKFTQKSNWIDGQVPPVDVKIYEKSPLKFNYPYAQKLVVKSKSKIDFFGDLHGSIQSLLRNFWRMVLDGQMSEDLILKQENNYKIFLGDYVDRGRYSVETLYLLFVSKIKNPEKFFFIRGNHEDPKMGGVYTYRDEIKNKYGDTDDTKRIVQKLLCAFELMPIVLYVGCNGDFVSVCHGGIDPLYDPCKLLTTSNVEYESLLDKKEDSPFLDNELKQNILKKSDSHFYAKGLNGCEIGLHKTSKGDDFIVDPNKIETRKGGQGYYISLQVIKKYFDELNKKLEKYNIRVVALIRGHQHMDFGLTLFEVDKDLNAKKALNWSDVIPAQSLNSEGYFKMNLCFPVFTLMSSPEGIGQSVLSGVQMHYNTDSFSTVIVGDTWDQWFMKQNDFPIEKRDPKGLYCSLILDKKAKRLKVNFSDKPEKVGISEN